MLPTKEKVVPTLILGLNEAHLISLYDINEAKVLVEGARQCGEQVNIVTVIGIDCLVIANFEILSMDLVIASQICSVYIGVVGLRGANYYTENTLKSALIE